MALVHPPLAVQEVELVEDHVRLEALPLATTVGEAEIVTVGAGVEGGGVGAWLVVVGTSMRKASVRFVLFIFEVNNTKVPSGETVALGML
jgi:hypothetical protein